MADDNRNDAQESGATSGGAKQWIEENLRLVVSVIIVLAIAGGIYSYSQRGQEGRVALDEDTTQEQILLEGEELEEDGMMEEDSETTEDSMVEEGVSSDETTEPAQEDAMEEDVRDTAPAQEAQPQQPAQPSQPTQETTEGFIVTAEHGDGLTHLARRAAADYLAQNPDDSLTAAHKIYIEDYVRKATAHSGGVHAGEQVSFSKSVISQAIDASKNLTDAQLDNLQKYVALVPSLS